MMGHVPLEEVEEAAALTIHHGRTQRRWPAAGQEGSPHHNSTTPSPEAWISSLHNYEKEMLFKPPSLVFCYSSLT